MMNWEKLTPNEVTTYWIGYHTANAARWRERAKLKELEGKDGSYCLEWAREDEAECERLLSVLNERKEKAR